MINFKFEQSKTGKSKCSTCGVAIKKDDKFFNIGKYGGYHSTSWVKMCKECIFRIIIANQLLDNNELKEFIVKETIQKL